MNEHIILAGGISNQRDFRPEQQQAPNTPVGPSQDVPNADATGIFIAVVALVVTVLGFILGVVKLWKK